MKYDIILAGVGGQGVLSVAAVIATAAKQAGLVVKQAEVHGMSQRGGAVVSHLRLADATIASDLVPQGSAALILGTEPLESLRYLSYLSADGALVTSTCPVRNITDYPDLDTLLAAARSLPKAVLVDSDRLARECGTARAANIVVLGAASRFLPLPEQALVEVLRAMFRAKGEKIVEANLKAFASGREQASP